MNIAIFQDITTEDALRELEANGEKYKGLFVDMNNPAERKFVKESASFINCLLKTLDRARIDKAREYKTAVEKEAEVIGTRLKAANEPYTLLIDQHNAERAEILAAKKAKEEAAALLIKIAEDHDLAVMEDKVRTFEKEEAIRAKKEHEASIAQQAKEQAELAARESIEQAKQAAVEAEERRVAYEAQAKQDAIEAEAKAKRDVIEATRLAEQKAAQIAAANRKRIEEEALAIAEAKAQREANTEHKRSINRTALNQFMQCGIDNDQAESVLIAIIKGKINNISIEY